METWKAVPGFEGRYEVSDHGRVRNSQGRVLSPNAQNSGYQIVHLYSGGRGTRVVRLVHRIVAAAFVSASPQDHEVNHIDGVKTNNVASNLEWVTRSGNIRHSVALGLFNAKCLAVVGTPLTGGDSVRFDSQSAAEKHFSGKNSSAVHHCLVGKKKSAYGHQWRVA